MKILSTQSQDIPQILTQIQSCRSKAGDVSEVVRPILDDIRSRGDEAVCDYTNRFDQWEASPTRLRVTSDEIQKAYEQIDEVVLDSLKQAMQNIEKVHTGMLVQKTPVIESMPGVKVWSEFRPVEKVGLYVPGGKAAYPSTVLMLGIPAKVAGCQQVIVCTPAGADGQCNPVVLVAADLCGITEIYKVGGAQAIATMAYGTETIPKVDKIFGPGNAYVTTAKQMVCGEGDCAIDMPAGPSEVCVLASDEANPNWVAADLLSQLEHDEDAQALLVCFSQKMANQVKACMLEQMKRLPRQAVVAESIKISFAVIVQNETEATELINGYAPEHLEIVLKSVEAEEKMSRTINNAGSIFLGALTSEPLGDYASGANHTLPTSGCAKAYPALSASSFGKMVQLQRVDQTGLDNLRGTVETLANAEGLQAHARAISIRFDS